MAAPMRFRSVKGTLVGLLGAASSGKFVVIGYQDSSRAAPEVLDEKRTIQVFYSAGDFPKSGGGLSGPVMHEISFRVELTVAKSAVGDWNALNNPASTPAELENALENFQISTDLADDSFDELVQIIYQILMDARNIDLGQDVSTDGPVANRWIGQVRKDKPDTRGQYVILTGYMELTCKVDEQVLGDVGTYAADHTVETSIDIQDENKISDESKSGTI
ncbi:MAG: hypothetical protein ACTSPB_12905 [Candidatus Thorarchaeota archaeon]